MRVKTELTFPGALKDEPIICQMCQKFKIILNILEASFSTATGWAILIVEGEQEELKNMFIYLKDKGVRFECLEEAP